MKKLFVLISFIIICLSNTFAQSFTANVDQTNVEFGDIVKVTYKLSDATGENFSPPSFAGMRLMSGPQVSNELVVNSSGRSIATSYAYILQAARKGKIEIGAATISVNGKRLQSNTLVINVSGGSKNNTTTSATGNIFLRAVPNKTQAIQGEAIAITYKLYLSNVANMAPPITTKMPTFKGFWAEMDNQTLRSQRSEEIINGKHYIVYIVRKIILFPQQSGNLTIDPLEIKCEGQMVQTSGNPNDPFSGMGDMFRQTVIPFDKIVASDGLKFNILPLPEKNKPASFTGMVGKVAISAYADHNTIKTNEPVIYRITVGGEGNLSLEQPFKLNLPPDIEVYDPKTIDKLDRSGDNLTGTRTFEYTLMPHKEGKYELPAIPFSYFDPVKKEYIESKTNALTLIVEKNDKIASDNDKAHQTKKNQGNSNSSLIWDLVLGVSVLALIAYIMFIRRKRNNRTLANAAEIPYTHQDYNIYLKQAGDMIEPDVSGDFYTIMLNALYSFMEQLLQIPFSDISHESIKIALEQKEIPKELIAKYLNVVDTCEMVKFAPAGFNPNKEDIFTRSKEVIEKINTALNPVL